MAPTVTRTYTLVHQMLTELRRRRPLMIRATQSAGVEITRASPTTLEVLVRWPDGTVLTETLGVTDMFVDGFNERLAAPCAVAAKVAGSILAKRV